MKHVSPTEGILIVDDNREERLHLHNVFCKDYAKNRIYKAATIDEACETLEANSIGVIFLDVWLSPEDNSLEAIRKFQAIDEHLVIILVSSDGSDSILEQSVDVGIYQLIEKHLVKNNWHRIKTAKELGISRNRLYKKMQALGIG